jgi:uncharacterized membrane protein YtjA (UPF0391 family)
MREKAWQPNPQVITATILIKPRRACYPFGIYKNFAEERSTLMVLSWALAFLVIAIVAGIFGFAGLAGTASWIAQVLFLIFLVAFIVSLFTGRRGRTSV